ncbi:hypothetical protein D3C81_1232000 [compost metagenome]
MKAAITATISVLLLAGCVNKPVAFSEAPPVPVDRMYAFQSSGDVQLLITRDSGLAGAGCNTRFYIDGTLAAEFSAGEGALFSVPAGERVLGITPSAACGGGYVIEREVTGRPGDSIRRRIFVSPTQLDLMPTTY